MFGFFTYKQALVNNKVDEDIFDAIPIINYSSNML